MEYIAITIVAIAITIFFVYKIGNGLLGLGLKLKPLILCALCALFISIVLPRIVVGFAGLAGTVAFLAVFAVIFAYFVAYYDEVQDPPITVSAAAAVLPVTSAGEDPLVNEADYSLTTMNTPTVNDELIIPEINSETAAATMPAVFIQEKAPVVSVFEDQQLRETEFLPDSLDDLLELAFYHKEELNFASALKYFREALKRFPESEAAPFLVVEIANILKNKGAYDEAIKVFTDGRNLPGLQLPECNLTQEFTETIAYLRIVRNILLERRLGFIPYHKIPADVCRDIDAEFREWRNFA